MNFSREISEEKSARIFEVLLSGPQCPCVLADDVSVGEKHIYHYLAEFLADGLISVEYVTLEVEDVRDPTIAIDLKRFNQALKQKYDELKQNEEEVGADPRDLTPITEEWIKFFRLTDQEFKKNSRAFYVVLTQKGKRVYIDCLSQLTYS